MRRAINHYVRLVVADAFVLSLIFCVLTLITVLVIGVLGLAYGRDAEVPRF